MKIENQVCSFELAEKLKELGVEQNSLYYYSQGPLDDSLQLGKLDNGWSEPVENISAFTATELLEMLPEFILPETEDEDYVLTIRQNEGCWSINYIYDLNIIALDGEFEDINICNALAKMLIYLKENNLTN